MVLALMLCMAAATAVSATAADLSDVETFLGETSFDEVQVSPDGSRLAFVTRRNDFAHDREELGVWTLDLATGDRAARPVRLAALGSCSALRWSPDGRWLSFLSAADPGGSLQLFVSSPAPGAAARRLTDPDRFQDGIDLYDWLPDSSGLVVEAPDSPPASAEAAGAAGAVGAAAAGRARRDSYGNVRRLPGPPPAGSLSRISLAGGRVERLAAAPFAEPGALAVSPDGRWLAIAGSGVRETAADTEVALLPVASPPDAAAAGAPRSSPASATSSPSPRTSAPRSAPSCPGSSTTCSASRVGSEERPAAGDSGMLAVAVEHRLEVLVATAGEVDQDDPLTRQLRRVADGSATAWAPPSICPDDYISLNLLTC
jgi:WD40-like Beta Propeller Repeat